MIHCIALNCTMNSFEAFLRPLLSSGFCCTAAGVHSASRQNDQLKPSSNNELYMLKGGKNTNHATKTKSPREYAEMIRQFQQDEKSDLPRFARDCAAEIPNFSCAHLVAGLQQTPQWDRAALVRSVLTHCKDLEENYRSIQSNMTEWELSITDRAFKKALDEKRKRQSSWFS